jgi:hypothetical protein
MAGVSLVLLESLSDESLVVVLVRLVLAVGISSVNECNAQLKCPMNHCDRLRLWWSTAQGHRHTTETNCAYGDIGVTELFRFHVLFDLAFVLFPLITESK